MTARSKIGLGLLGVAVCAALVPATPAFGEIVLHRDPSAAVPLVADVSGSADDHPVIHRDGTAAVPFVAQVGLDPVSGSEGFDWGDAALGALAGGVLVLLGIQLVRVAGRRGARFGVAG